jgi:hypothetical protein
MTLLEVTEKLGEADREHTIYAARPWSPDSAALVAAEPERGGVPADAAQHGMSYLLEVFIARDFLDDWQASLAKKPSTQERCRRMIEYAINDA